MSTHPYPTARARQLRESIPIFLERARDSHPVRTEKVDPEAVDR